MISLLFTVARSKLLKLLTMSVKNLDTSGHIILLQIKQCHEKLNISMKKSVFQ